MSAIGTGKVLTWQEGCEETKYQRLHLLQDAASLLPGLPLGLPGASRRPIRRPTCRNTATDSATTLTLHMTYLPSHNDAHIICNMAGKQADV